MAINFPASPATNQTYTYNGRTWTYNGVGWQATGASGLSVYTKTDFTATAAQTTFTVAYTVGFVDVYYNGSKLSSSEYTATNGTSVVLGTACAVNDIVETVAWTVSTTLNPALGVATATSLAIGGATIGSNALAVTGSSSFPGSTNITAAGLVGIGMTPSNKLEVAGYTRFVSGSYSASSTGVGLEIFYDSVSDSAISNSYNRNTSTWKPWTIATSATLFNISGTEAARFGTNGYLGIGVTSPACILDISGASGGQIKFPATMNASSNANTLDDYEEGTWTPTFTSTGATFTYGTRYASYTKIGNLVTLMVYMNMSGVSGTTTNPITLSGFPFTSIGGTFSSSGVFGVEQFTVRPTFFLEASMATANIYQAGTVSAMTAVMTSVGFYLYALTYQTA